MPSIQSFPKTQWNMFLFSFYLNGYNSTYGLNRGNKDSLGFLVFRVFLNQSEFLYTNFREFSTVIRKPSGEREKEKTNQLGSLLKEKEESGRTGQKPLLSCSE